MWEKGCDQKLHLYTWCVCVCGYYAAVNEYGTEKSGNKNDKVSFHLQGVVIADWVFEETINKAMSYKISHEQNKNDKTSLSSIKPHKHLIIQLGYFQWLVWRAITDRFFT